MTGPAQTGVSRILLPLAATLLAMAAFQTGAALAKSLFPVVGSEGAASLRLGIGALILLAMNRPWRNWPEAAPILPLLGLGASMAGVVMMFYLAMSRLPLGVAIALQFLGPLAVALMGSRKPSDLVWAVLAGAGVWMLVGVTSHGLRFDLIGVGYGLAAAVCWGAYILFGRVVTARFGGSTATLAVSIAAVISLPVGLHHAGWGLVSPHILPLAAFVALLSTAVPFSLEFYAMARMPGRTFAVFTSLEPVLGLFSGLVFLHEQPSLKQIVGIGAVIIAAAGAAWSSAGGRLEAPPT